MNVIQEGKWGGQKNVELIELKHKHDRSIKERLIDGAIDFNKIERNRCHSIDRATLT